MLEVTLELNNTVIIRCDGFKAGLSKFTMYICLDFILDHGWFFAKLNIENILLLDFFGGVKTMTLDEYLDATPY